MTRVKAVALLEALAAISLLALAELLLRVALDEFEIWKMTR